MVHVLALLLAVPFMGEALRVKSMNEGGLNGLLGFNFDWFDDEQGESTPIRWLKEEKQLKMRMKTEDSPSAPNYLKQNKPGSGNITYKYYLLNLDRRPNRLSKFAKVMRPSMQDNICRIKAVDGQTLGAKDFANGTRLHGRSTWPVQKAEGWNDLKPGALGCFMSHTLAWDQIEKDGVDVGIVIEDDVYQYSKTFDEDVKKQVLNEENLKHYNVLLMSHCAGAMGENMGMHKGGTACTGMMAVPRRSIPQMKKELFPVREAIDSQLNLKMQYKNNGFSIYVAEPKMADQDHSQTDIQNFRQKLDDTSTDIDRAHQLIPDCE